MWDASAQENILVDVAPAMLFAWLDEPRNTGLHMSRPSLAMLGGALRVERLSSAPTGVGATYRSWGRVLGLPIDFTTTVTDWIPDREKIWRTTGKPRLIVLGDFEMRFSLEPRASGTSVTLALAYNFPSSLLGRLLGRIFGGPYARWCLRRMARDARAALSGRVNVRGARS